MNNRSIEEPKHIINYLEKQGLFIEVREIDRIGSGASGAKVYRVIDRTGSYVVKHTHPSFCGLDQHLLSSYEREWRFYSAIDNSTFPAIPQTLHVENNPELGIILVFPYYERTEFPLRRLQAGTVPISRHQRPQLSFAN